MRKIPIEQLRNARDVSRKLIGFLGRMQGAGEVRRVITAGKGALSD